MSNLLIAIREQEEKIAATLEQHGERIGRIESRQTKIDKKQIEVINLLVRACRMALDDIQDHGGPKSTSEALANALDIAGFPDIVETRVQ